MLDLQRSVGNRALAAMVTGAAPNIQRLGLIDKLKARLGGPKAPAANPTEASDRAREEQLTYLPEVQALVKEKDRLTQAPPEGDGLTEEEARTRVYEAAPLYLKRYLPMTDEFSQQKRKNEQYRNVAGAEKAGQVSAGLEAHADELGYTPGSGSPVAAKPKDIEKQMQEDLVDKRAKERIARRRNILEQEQLKEKLQAADPSERPAIEQRIAFLDSSAAVDETVKRIDDEAAALAQGIVQQKVTAWFKEKGAFPNKEERIVIENEAAKVAEDTINHGRIDKLDDAAKIIGLIAKGSKPAGKGILKAGEKAGASSQLFQDIVTSAGKQVKAIASAFKGIADVINTVQDIRSGRYDNDTALQLASTITETIGKTTKQASGAIKAFTKLGGILNGNAAAADAIPGLGIVSNVFMIATYVLDGIAPGNRIASTVKAMSSTDSNVLWTALDRTTLESTLQLSTAVTGVAAQIVTLTANIIELATAGGMGVPAALKAGAKAGFYAKKAIDFATLEFQKSKTQTARKKAIAGEEGSSKQLIKTDIAHAIDTVVVHAKEGDKDAVDVLVSYGLDRDEVLRMGFAELRDKMFDKLGQDEEQATVAMKAKAKVKDVKEKLVGGDEEKGPVTLEETLAKKQAEKDAGKLGKLKGYASKLKKASPVAIGKQISEAIAEKKEKTRRVRMVKNAIGYKGSSDRGGAWGVKAFLGGTEGQEEKLRKHIRKHYDDEQGRFLLRDLSTTAEQQKMLKNAGKKAQAAEVAAEKPSDRVVTPAVVDIAKNMDLPTLTDFYRTLYQHGDLSPADDAYLTWKIRTLMGVEGDDTFRIKKAS